MGECVVPVTAIGVERERVFLYLNVPASDEPNFSADLKSESKRSLGEAGCVFAVQSNADGEGSRKNPFQTGVTFFRALILGVGSLPADASVWLGIAKNICDGHQGNGLTLLHTHSNHICTEFSSSCI